MGGSVCRVLVGRNGEYRMKTDEAIEMLRAMQNKVVDYAEMVGAPDFAYGCKYVYPEPEDYAIEEAIKALEEIQQYLEIGTVEECREAVEKQRSKILEFYGSREDGKLLCQNCGEDLWDLRECGFNNCPYCGQAILWENLEGME